MVGLVANMITYNSFIGAISLSSNYHHNYYYHRHYHYYYDYYYYYYYDHYYYHYKDDYRPTYIYDLNCIGVENNIWDCPYVYDNYYYCNGYEGAAVICQCKYTVLYHTIAIY